MKTETTQSPTTKSHLSVAFIPFSFSKENLVDLTNQITTFSAHEDFDFFDSIKYHKHIENLIVNPLKLLKEEKVNNSAFLKIYKIDNQYIQKIEKLNFNSQVHELRIDDNHHLKFTNHNYVVLNEFAEIGYFVFGFEIISLNNGGLVDFADCEFFRFISKNDPKYKLKIFPIQERREFNSVTNTEDGFEFQFKGTKQKNYFKNEDEYVDIKLELQNDRELKLLKEKNKTTNLVLKNSNDKILDRWEIITKDGISSLKNSEVNSFNISQLINEGLYSSIDKYIDFNKIEKPILLHLFNESNNEFIDHKELEVLLYRTIRIKSKNVSDISANLELLNRTYSDISFCALMEGASIMDLSNDFSHNGFFNKYFASFLLLLNQREVMIKFNAEFSSYTYEELIDARASKNDEVIEKIKELKNKIGFFKFKQVIHSVSFYDEITTFYKQLFSAFDIKLLLEDNESSVNEIHDVLVHVENNTKEEVRKENEKNEAKQSKMINSILGGIGCLGLFSFFKDLIPFMNDSQYQIYYKTISFILTIFFVFLLFILIFFNNSKRNKE